MKRSQRPTLIFLILILIGALSFFFGTGTVLKTQVLQAPESLDEVKLIRLETDPVQFDLYYQGLKRENPPSVSITLLSAILDEGNQFTSTAQILQSLVLITGSSEISGSTNSQSLTIRNILPQSSTKLGTIFTNIPQTSYVSLEYDVTISGKRTTHRDKPLGSDFPQNYHRFQNPTGESLYVAVPGFHTLLAPLEVIYLKYPEVRFGAILLENAMTTLQETENLSSTTLIRQPLKRETAQLVIEQNQIMIPPLPENNLNTLIFRFKGLTGDWRYRSFLLTASKDITLPVEVKDLLDFYTDIEYSFAYLSNAMGTVNLEYPYNSLLEPDHFPVFYRTPFVSLIPELNQQRSGLPIELRIATAQIPKSLYIGLLAREQITSLPEALHYLEQKLPVALFDQSSATFKTIGRNSQNLPYFHILGKNNQVWSKQIQRPDLEYISTSFQPIELIPDDDQLPLLEVVNQQNGDRLLCFVKSDEGSFSLPTIRTDIILTSACLRSARRAGISSGEIFPVVYRQKTKSLEALKNYRYDERLSDTLPLIKSYDPIGKTLTLNAGFEDKELKVMVSPKQDFKVSETQTLENTGRSTFALSPFPGCNTVCYFKVIALIREDSNILLGYDTETLVFSPTPEPFLQLCPVNQAEIQMLFDPEELFVQVMKNGQSAGELSYKRDSGCYEIGSEASLISLIPLISSSQELPENTIVLQTNGYSNSFIEIPPQRFYLSLENQSEQQVLLAELAFLHVHLSSAEQSDTDFQLKTSYQISQWGNQGTFYSVNRGTLLIQQLGKQPYFLEKFSAAAAINESLLFPSGAYPLEIPHTIRLIPPEQIILQGYSEGNNSAELDLDIPERSQVRLFLDNIFRPEIQQQVLLNSGILYNSESGLMTLENPTGSISIPIVLSLDTSTNTEVYGKTIPSTKVPDEIHTAFLESTLVFQVNQPDDIPRSSIREPITLRRAEVGIPYREKLPLFGVEKAKAYEILDSRFLTTTCTDIFQFDPTEREIRGTVPDSSRLEGCYFQILVRYLIRNDFADMEISTPLSYQIPLLEYSPNDQIPVDIVFIPISKGSEEINESITILKPIEELVETTPQFVSKNNTESLISSFGDLLIVFDETNQQFIISGIASDLTQTVSRYIRAIEKETGRLALFELRIIPVSQREIIIPITQSFPNLVDVPQILLDEGYTTEEISTLRIEVGSIAGLVELSNTGIVNIFGLPELHDRAFHALLQKTSKTPSAFDEFNQRLTDQAAEDVPDTLRIDLRLQIQAPETIQGESLHFGTDKLMSIDLNRFAPSSDTLITGQLPEFLTREGNQLKGRTPPEAQELSLLIQDFSSIRNIIVPLVIGGENRGTEDRGIEGGSSETGEENPSITKKSTLESDLEKTKTKAAEDPTNCFPDIQNQPLAYRETICLAKEYGVISGSGGLFKPDSPINRAEVSKILVTGPLVLLGLLSEAEAQRLNSAYSLQSFRDVPTVSWFYGFVEAVREIGIFSGYPDASFRPGENINSAEAAKVIVNTVLTLEASSFSFNESISSNTLPGDLWFAPYVRILKMNGGDLPEPADATALSKPMTRAEFIYNLLILLDSKAESISVGL